MKEVNELHARTLVLERDNEILIEKITEQTEIQKETAQDIKDLTLSIKDLAHGITDTQKTAQMALNQVAEVKDELQDFTQFARPIVVEAKKGQDFWRKVKDGAASTTGKISIMVALAGIAILFGLDPTKLFKG